jgi:hypothetical protein
MVRLLYPSPPSAVCRVREALMPRPPRLLDRVRSALRARHYSRRTEEAYVAWIRRYIISHGKRHPAEMGAPEVTGFLTSRVLPPPRAGRRLKARSA